jgi:hypothetical protein
MKKVLVICYSQTGQLNNILNSLLTSLRNDPEIEITFETLEPDPPFTFPYTAESFFQTFPESVKGIPCRLKPFKFLKDKNFDLVIIGYQIWYLSPSIPFHAFFQSDEAKELLRDKLVITIIGCRNMWVMAQEKIKKYLAEAGSKLVGNIVLRDKAPNLLSVISIVRWLFKNKKERYLGFIPPAGVSDKDIKAAERFGKPILKSLQTGDYSGLQCELLKLKAVELFPSLLMIEKSGSRLFGLWAKWVLKKGNYGDKKRSFRLKVFMYYLFAVIYLISPIGTLVFYLTWPLRICSIKRNKAYYSGCDKKK